MSHVWVAGEARLHDRRLTGLEEQRACRDAFDRYPVVDPRPAHDARRPQGDVLVDERIEALPVRDAAQARSPHHTSAGGHLVWIRLARAVVARIRDAIVILVVRRPERARIAGIIDPVRIDVVAVRCRAELAAIVDPVATGIFPRRHAEAVVARIVDPVAVGIGATREAIADVAEAVVVGVPLLRVWIERAVVGRVAHAIVIQVGERRLESEEVVARRERDEHGTSERDPHLAPCSRGSRTPRSARL